ncbi:hypothetical protein [Hansschlegelia zhihuaiae]|uniref:hypothetical protein n=1 Tax=Hansschlegelia zhihuaiae TaxID=405005 RepID=UPI0019D4D591|nr:hypothetical protein [Hansschlegelia zhihuaiae]
MPRTTDDLVFAQRHVSHGESMVKAQQSIIDSGLLSNDDQRTAEAWLAVFKAGLEKHIAERDKIVEELATRFP